MYEHRGESLLSRRKYLRRIIVSALFGFTIFAASLTGGMLGYMYFESMPPAAAFANAAMILSGMGPLSPLKTFGGTIFAGAYALYSGLAFIVITGVVLAPVIHRFLHRFHLQE